jgi:L-glyceraldehyde 3-phosphate reductase
MEYKSADNRYESMKYNRCGKSGIKLPAVSLGLWHNFGGVDTFESFRKVLLYAFDSGISHIDLANNYGPPPGSAEENFGVILKKDLSAYRDELIISTKAGYDMWPGPYGNFGSRKYLLASLDQSLKRMGLEYVDIFYSHRPDSETPLEETMGALAQAVRQGKALYTGISNYPPEDTREAIRILKEMDVPCLIHQFKYSMLMRNSEEGLLDVLEETGVGGIAFSPLAQGLLTNKYLKEIPPDSRAGKVHGQLKVHEVTDAVLNKVRKLNDIAASRNQSLAQMALAWLLKDPRITSVLVGAGSVEQLKDTLNSLNNPSFSGEELTEINNILQ